VKNIGKNHSQIAGRPEIPSGNALFLKADPRIQSQTRLVLLVALSVFISEAAVMLVISFLPASSIWLHALFGATLLVILLPPVLYFCLF
jgi:hypothetical protein